VPADPRSELAVSRKQDRRAVRAAPKGTKRHAGLREGDEARARKSELCRPRRMQTRRDRHFFERSIS